MTKEEARQKIAELVKKYEALSGKDIKSFNEANTKQGFILPLFAALGWDVFDTHEVAMEEAASNKRVDFAFKLNGVARFYLEAKPLKADLNNPDYIKQAITYAYSNGVTWAILTDFETLRVFSAQAKDDQGFINIRCKDYVKEFDDLWLLSKESMGVNALSEKAQKYGRLPPLIPHIQYRSATDEAAASIGVLNPRHFLGRLFSRLSTRAICSSVILAKSVPFGKYHLTRPLAFSFVPLSHEAYGWAK